MHFRGVALRETSKIGSHGIYVYIGDQKDLIWCLQVYVWKKQKIYSYAICCIWYFEGRKRLWYCNIYILNFKAKILLELLLRKNETLNLYR